MAHPEMLTHFLFWMQTDPLCPLGWMVVCQPKEGISDQKQMGKRNQRNTHGPGFLDTVKKHLHINML